MRMMMMEKERIKHMLMPSRITLHYSECLDQDIERGWVLKSIEPECGRGNSSLRRKASTPFK